MKMGKLKLKKVCHLKKKLRFVQKLKSLWRLSNRRSPTLPCTVWSTVVLMSYLLSFSLQNCFLLQLLFWVKVLRFFVFCILFQERKIESKHKKLLNCILIPEKWLIATTVVTGRPGCTCQGATIIYSSKARELLVKLYSLTLLFAGLTPYNLG